MPSSHHAPLDSIDRRDLLDLAIDEAVAGVAARAGGPFGAVIVKDGTVIAKCHNRVTSTLDPTAHAEVLAIRAACTALGCYELSGSVLYASCEPCPMCLGAILWARIDRVFFAASRLDAERAGFDDARFYREFAHASAAGARPEWLVHVAEHPRAVEPFVAWSELVDRLPY